MILSKNLLKFLNPPSPLLLISSLSSIKLLLLCPVKVSLNPFFIEEK